MKVDDSTRRGVGSTTQRVDRLVEGMIVRLTVYDLLGREVATLVNKQLKPGLYEVEWDGTNYPSGVYLYQLNAGDFRDTKRLVLLK